jgi:large subunit ribosomal protein L3
MKKKFILGKKIGMTHLITPEGLSLPVTVLAVEENTVVDVASLSGDALCVVLGVGSKKSVNKPLAGFYEKRGLSPKAFLKGFRSSGSLFQGGVGSSVGVSVFEVGEKVSVRAKTIGRGFTGTIKRHNFSRGPMSHGSKSHRIPGSIGAGTTPGRVFKGTRMSGHYGDSFVTVKNLRVEKVDAEKGLLFLRGAVPGKSGIVEIFM